MSTREVACYIGCVTMVLTAVVYRLAPLVVGWLS